MYTPKHFDSLHPGQSPIESAWKLVEKRGFGSLISSHDGEIQVSMLPFVRKPNDDVLLTHLAIANPHLRSLDGQKVVCIFEEADAYISPLDYASSPHVPTWNYSVAEVRGVARLQRNDEQKLQSMHTLVKHFEGTNGWLMSDVPSQFVEQLLKAIVFVEIEVTSIQGKWKLSQNRNAPDRESVIARLQSRDDARSKAIASMMKLGR